MIRLASNDNDVSLRLAFCAAEYEMNIVTNVFDLLENQNHITMPDENIITFFFSRLIQNSVKNFLDEIGCLTIGSIWNCTSFVFFP